jgi:hypothetical protein
MDALQLSDRALIGIKKERGFYQNNPDLFFCDPS